MKYRTIDLSRASYLDEEKEELELVFLLKNQLKEVLAWKC
jgi:hypothetical protein